MAPLLAQHVERKDSFQLDAINSSKVEPRVEQGSNDLAGSVVDQLIRDLRHCQDKILEAGDLREGRRAVIGLADIKQYVESIKDKVDQIQNLEGEAREKAFDALKEFMVAFSQYDAMVLPDEAGILPVAPSNPGKPQVGTGIGFDFIWMQRQMQLQRSIEEFLAMVDWIRDSKDSTGYPLGQIFVTVASQVIEHREIEAGKLVEEQRMTNEITSQFNKALAILNQIKANIGHTPARPGEAEELARLTTEFSETMRDLLGDDWTFDASGDFIPGPDSKLAGFIAALGPDFKSNPAYSLISGFARDLHNAPLPGNEDTNVPAEGRPTINLLVAMTDLMGRGELEKWIRVMGTNYQDNIRNPNPNDRCTDYINPKTDSLGTIQGGLSGFAQTTTMQIQREFGDISQFSDTADGMLKLLDKLISSINSATR